MDWGRGWLIGAERERTGEREREGEREQERERARAREREREREKRFPCSRDGHVRWSYQWAIHDHRLDILY
jgi:hypothetical protein